MADPMPIAWCSPRNCCGRGRPSRPTGSPTARSGPRSLLTGSPELQQRYLPRIATGEFTFCIGLSETEAGSDLASVRTVAESIEGGWQLRGRKIWTSHAHRATHAYVLARTNSSGAKHEGLTEFLVDMAAAGVHVQPIHDLRGNHHFNEVTFDDVYVPADHVLGEVGNGWKQVTEQLAFERGGMERVLSTYPLLNTIFEEAEAGSHAECVGVALARLATLRRLAWRIAMAMDRGEAPIQQAAMLKVLGTRFECDVNELARAVLRVEPDPNASGAAGLLADGVFAAPGFTIRGGTSEILQTIIARGVKSQERDGSELRAVADDVLRGHGGDPGPTLDSLWTRLTELGWTGVATPENLGGSGGELADLIELVQACARHAVAVPLAETTWTRLLLAASDQRLDDGPATVIVGAHDVALDGDHLSGTATRVPWAAVADRLLVAVGEELVMVERGAPGIEIRAGVNLASEPRDTVRLDRVPVTARVPCRQDPAALGALLKAAAIVGALEAAVAHTIDHVNTREQFGRPLAAFQAVGATMAHLAAQHTLARTALQAAVGSCGDGIDVSRVAVAMVIATTAATEVARGAHQLHGAMGVTREHPLHLTTRRLWSWRDELGGRPRWAALLGSRLLAVGPNAIWDWVTTNEEER